MECIDINCTRIIEWLSERKKISKDWINKIRALNARQKELIDALKSSEGNVRVREDAEGFLQAQDVFQQLLQGPEVQKGKTLLGNYVSQVLYDWDRLMRLYNKDNIHLADTARYLAQIAEFEVPGLKQQLANYEKFIQDSYTRERAVLESIENTKKNFLSHCAALGITGQDIRKELKAITRKLPEIYLEIQTSLLNSRFQESIQLYRETTLNSHSCEISLPTIQALSILPEVDIEELKDFYSPAFKPSTDEFIDSESAGVLVISGDPEEETEWVIESIEAGEEAAPVKDLPLADKKIRSNLINELTELAAFAESSGEYVGVAEGILNKIKDAQEMIVLREQSLAIERLAQKLERINHDKLDQELKSIRSNIDTTKQAAKQARDTLIQHLKIASELIQYLEPHISTLFPNISIKLVGEIVKDIKTFK